MTQPPSSWDPNSGQQNYPQQGSSGYGSGQYGQGEGYGQPAYSPPPQYGGYPPAETQQQYGQGYGQPSGTQRPGAALAAAVLSYIQAGVVLFSSFFILAAGSAATELLLIGILQLISVGLLIFGAVQITSGSGRNVLIAACVLQLLLVVYYLIRLSTIGGDIDFDDDSGVVIVVPLFFAVMPAVALGLIFNRMVSQYIAAKAAQRPAPTQQWGQQ